MVRPSAATTASNTPPIARPTDDASPAFQFRFNVRDNTYNMEGPGDALRAKPAIQTIIIVSRDGNCDSLLLSGPLAIVTRGYFKASDVSDHVMQSLLKHTKCRRAIRTIIQPRRFVAFTNIREITNESLHHVMASHHRVMVFLVRATMSMGHGLLLVELPTPLSDDALKIDHSFIIDVDNNRGDKRIVAAIVAMAHALRLRVSVERVETRDQLRNGGKVLEG